MNISIVAEATIPQALKMGFGVPEHMTSWQLNPQIASRLPAPWPASQPSQGGSFNWRRGGALQSRKLLGVFP